MDRRRGAASGRGREAFHRRPVAHRQRRADRLVHRRGSAAARDRLPRTRTRAQGARTVRSVLVAAAALAWYAGAWVEAQETPRFAWHLPLATPGEQAFYRVDVPASVYVHVVRADLGDVRVLNCDGAAVPFAFLPP